MSKPPKLFVSYSWSTPEHDQWVIDLATDLVKSGVEVILDKWDLKEGHDAVQFMEKMVTDESIQKVLMVCDSTYSSKADQRAGGVGTETQIISRNVYESASQEKFVAVIAEKDTDGKPFLPTYYKSRIYIDLSESELYAENFEKLLRWIFNKPLHVKPAIGKQPEFLTTTVAPTSATNYLSKRLIDGLKNDKAYVRGALDEYLSLYSASLEDFRITKDSRPLDEQIVQSIEGFLPVRNEYLQVLLSLVQYSDFELYGVRIHRFFESLLTYQDRPENVNQWNDEDFDNFKFLIHELFLYTIGILLKAERFDAATYLLAIPYYTVSSTRSRAETTKTFDVFRQYLRSLEERNRRLSLSRASLHADLLLERSKLSGVAFHHLMQADFVCFLRAEIHGGEYENWYPDTLVYANRQYGAFEVFARSESRSYLPKVLDLLGVAGLKEITEVIQKLSADPRSLPRWSHYSISPGLMVGIDRLGKKG